MNKLKIIFFIGLCILSFSACEKDDICVEGDTPLLIVRFFDIDNPTEFKPVPGLRVVGIGNGAPVNTFADRSSTLDSIGIPLRTDESLTSFVFIMDSADDENGAEEGVLDQLPFTYNISEDFISRACGFIAIYDNLNTDFATAPESWIQRIEIVNPTVEPEEIVTAHVKIFH